MRSTRCLVVAAVLAGMIASAKADTYSVDIPFNIEINIFDTTRLQPKLFDSSKGTLKSVDLNFVGYTGGITTGVPTYDPSDPFFSDAPQTLGFINSLGIMGDYINFYKQFPETYGDIRAQYSDVISSVPSQFNFTISAPRISIPDYANCSSCIIDELRGGATDYNAATGGFFRPGGGSQDALFLASGRLTETFTYKPTHVPEPGSFAMLGTAAVMLAGATQLTRRRRPRS